MPATNPSITTFTASAPPWSLTSLDANFSNIAAILASVNTYEQYVVDTGAANAYVATFGAGVSFTLSAGVGVSVKASADNTTASTLNVNGSGIKNILNFDGSALVAGQIKTGGIFKVIYDGTQYLYMGPFTGAMPGVFTPTPGGIKFTGASTVTATGTNAFGSIGTTATTGLVLQGKGSTGDFVLQNSAGAAVASNLTGTTTFVLAGALSVATGNVGIGVAADAAAGARLHIVAVTGNSQAILVTHVDVAEDVISMQNSATAGDNVFTTFYTEVSPTSRGSITYNRGGGLVVYNTTSDYRAKDVSAGLVIDAGKMLSELQVYDGLMHGATIRRPMLVAHEVQAIAPWAVTGHKDEVDKKGKPIYQQLSEGSFAPLLIAGWQAHDADIKSLLAWKAKMETA